MIASVPLSVETRTGLSRIRIHYDLNDPLTPALSPLVRGEGVILGYIKDGVFPKSVPLGPRAVSWLESDVSEWIAARVRIARDSGRQSA